jgi:hypothetical protein
VTFTSPEGTQVPAGSPISALFSEPIDPRTVNATTFTLKPVVSGAVSYDPNTQIATFVPTTALSLGSPYVATIGPGVRDLTGNIAQARSWTFTLAVQYSGFVSNINAEHDEHVRANSNAWSGQFSSQGIGLAWVVAQEGDHWKYTYLAYATIKGTDKWVNSLCIGTPDGFDSTDLLAGWSLVEPVKGEVAGEARDGVLTDFASVLTRPGSAQTHIAASGLPTSAGLFGIRWQMPNGSAGSFKPEVANTMVILTFSTRRAPAWGDVLLESSTPSGGGPTTAWNTHLADSTDALIADGNNGGWVLVPGMPGPDTEPPTVPELLRQPAPGSAGLSIHGSVSAGFSEAMDSATLIGKGAFTLADDSGAPVSGTVAYDPLSYIARFTPSAPLSYDHAYTATVAGAKDLAGHVMAPVTWTFTTESPDTTLPRVLSVSPKDGDTNVAVGVAITARFSETIEPSNLATAFTVGDVAGTVSYAAATNTAVFTPAAPLAYDTAYTATVTGVWDLSGNAMVGSPFSWSFTTALPPPYVPNGDANGDGIVDIQDARLALRIAAGEATPTSEQLRAGDVAPLVNGAPSPNGKIDVGDVLVILRKVAGQESW